MKLLFIVIGLGTGLLSLLQTNPEQQQLLGKWNALEENNGQRVEFIANFRKDGSYDGIANGKVVVSGRYRQQGDTVVFNDAICQMAYDGLYKLDFFQDSVRFTVLKDTCTLRVNGSNGFAFKRVKK